MAAPVPRRGSQWGSLVSAGKRVYFVLACARSGSTSLARILDEASNGVCAVEPAPNLNWETRRIMDGRLDDPAAVIERDVAPRVAAALEQHEIYGEKNLTYGPFIPWLHRRFDCRFVLIVRDGSEVVRSMMDWHNRMFGTIYRECADPGDLSPRALFAAGNLPLHLDTSDYSRPRPLPGEPFSDDWMALSREAMCAYYWARTYGCYLDELEQLPRENWIRIDYDAPAADDVLRVAEFLELEGLDRETVAGMLDQRINSLRDRIDEAPCYPNWPQWTDDRRSEFRRIAGPVAERLGVVLE